MHVCDRGSQTKMSPLRQFMCVITLLLGAASLLGAPKPGPSSRLYFGTEDLPGLQARLQGEQGQEIMKRLEESMSTGGVAPEAGQRAAGWALRHVWAKEPGALEKALQAAEQSLAQMQKALSPKQGSRLDHVELARNCLGLAIAYDLCQTYVPAERRLQLRRGLLQLGGRILAGAGEKSRSVDNSAEKSALMGAAGLCALALVGDPESSTEPLALARLARNQMQRFLEDCGTHGWPREGFGKLHGSLGNGIGAFLLAWRRHSGEDLISHSPALWWPSLYNFLLIPPDLEPPNSPPDLPFFGMLAPGANKAPSSRWEPGKGGDVATLLAMADAASQASLQWTFEHCFRSGGGAWDINKASDALFLVLGLHSGESSINPAKVLGYSWQDERQGIFLYRNRWLDSLDSVAGISANQRPMPFRSQPETGSFRLLALGGHWAVQRHKDAADLGQALREKENVVVIPGTHGWQPGRVLQSAAQPDGSGAVTLNLDAVFTVASPGSSPALLEPTQDLGIRAQRAWAIDYSGACEAPVLMVVADNIRNGPTRRWLMHTEERDVTIRSDGFELRAPNGAHLKATVITPLKPRIRVDRGLWTDTLSIDGEGDFFVVMTVQAKEQDAPKPIIKGQGLDAEISIGGCVIRYDGHGIAIQ
jgi:hypothetical protein